MPPVQITYYSDILCIWAYIAKRRIEELVERFGDDVAVEARFCSVFPDAWGKIEEKWAESGGFAGFGRHLNEVALKFPHIEVHERLWLDNRPRTSASAHQFIKAIEIIEREAGAADAPPVAYLERLSTRAAGALRRAFFAEAKDISNWRVHGEIADLLGIDYALVEQKIRSSEAVARLAVDYDLSHKQGIEGSPTFVMNDGRQKLFGNVGYRLLEANVAELLRRAPEGEASWC
ncbi:MAG: DsbA family protein [Alphaproteobacteria bacterium]|jgi:predicted DsbA family dithiol-disulfide isomerase|nr:DsbA family protein [Alphaproteobacteria bacterium]MDP6589326.1 DsbA family protein [Alphaproteobacteria bacterium]MDP6818067.1 DsbA family protein [Alphaproteobacteria bacterium]